MNITDKHVAENRAKINKNIENKLIKMEVISTIDEMNQYLNGNVTKLGLRMALNELINRL